MNLEFTTTLENDDHEKLEVEAIFHDGNERWTLGYEAYMENGKTLDPSQRIYLTGAEFDALAALVGKVRRGRDMVCADQNA